MKKFISLILTFNVFFVLLIGMNTCVQANAEFFKATTIEQGKKKRVKIKNRANVVFKITPKVSGEYQFYSKDDTNNLNIFGEILDSTGNCLESSNHICIEPMIHEHDNFYYWEDVENPKMDYTKFVMIRNTISRKNILP